MVFIDKERIMTRENFIKVFQNFDEVFKNILLKYYRMDQVI